MNSVKKMRRRPRATFIKNCNLKMYDSLRISWEIDNISLEH